MVERWVLARLRHHRFFSLSELYQAIAGLLEELNQRPFQKLPGSRKSAFVYLDKPGINYHVDVDKRYYSVPHRWVGHVLVVRATTSVAEVFHKGQRIAIHPRSHNKRFSTLPEHMPSSHRQHREWSPGRFLNWAKQIGPATLAVVKRQLEDLPHPEHGYRRCLGLLSLARRYGKARLKAACERALAIHSPNYRSVSSILKQGLDRQPLSEDEPTQGGTAPARQCARPGLLPLTDRTHTGQHHVATAHVGKTARPQTHRHGCCLRAATDPARH